MSGFAIGSRMEAGGRVSSQALAEAALLAAPGAAVWYDSRYGVSLSSTLVTAWASRIGSETVTAVTTARPTYGSVLSGGRPGITFDGTANTLSTLSSALPTAIDASEPYSALYVAKTAGGATRAVWSIGNSAIAEYVGEGTSSGADWRIRRTVALASTANTGSVNPGTNIHTFSTVYTGAAYSTWVQRAASLAASANTRAPVCDTFSIGSLRSGAAPFFFFDGTIWAVIVAPSTQWTAAQRQVLENAAQVYYSTV